MTPKNAALLAFIGTLLLTILVTFDFVNTVSGVLRDIVPVMALVRSLIYLLASVTVTVFFYIFYKA
jgi:sorbitol-specific phosphotransferase system component IIBC